MESKENVVSSTLEGCHETPPALGSAFLLGGEGAVAEGTIEAMSAQEVVLTGPFSSPRKGALVKLILKLDGARLLVVRGVVEQTSGVGARRQVRVRYEEPPQHTRSLLQAMVRSALDRAPEPGAAQPVPPSRPGRA